MLRRLALDLDLSLREVDVRWVRELRAFAPFGPGNPKLTVLLRGVAVESRSARTGWLTDGTLRIAARGRLPVGEHAARYDLVGTPGLTDGELMVAVSDARDSSAP